MNPTGLFSVSLPVSIFSFIVPSAGTLTDKQSQIMDAYVAVIKGGGSLREIDSILGQIKFLIDNLPPADAAVGPLRSILDGVKKKSLVPGAVRPARG